MLVSAGKALGHGLIIAVSHLGKKLTFFFCLFLLLGLSYPLYTALLACPVTILALSYPNEWQLPAGAHQGPAETHQHVC